MASVVFNQYDKLDINVAGDTVSSTGASGGGGCRSEYYQDISDWYYFEIESVNKTGTLADCTFGLCSIGKDLKDSGTSNTYVSGAAYGPSAGGGQLPSVSFGSGIWGVLFNVATGAVQVSVSGVWGAIISVPDMPAGIFCPFVWLSSYSGPVKIISDSANWTYNSFPSGVIPEVLYQDDYPAGMQGYVPPLGTSDNLTSVVKPPKTLEQNSSLAIDGEFRARGLDDTPGAGGTAVLTDCLIEPTGKYYWEVYLDQTNPDASIGLRVGVTTDDPTPPWSGSGTNNQWGVITNGAQKFADGTTSSYLGSKALPLETGVYIGIAYDVAAGTLKFARNGVWYEDPTDSGVPAPITGVPVGALPFIYVDASFRALTMVVEEDFMEGSLPTGYSYLSRDNPPLVGTIQEDIPFITADLRGGTGNYVAVKQLSYVTGEIKASSQIAMTFASLTGSVRTGGEITGELPSTSGNIRGASQLQGELIAVSGAIEQYKDSHLEVLMPHVSGGMVAGYNLDGSLIPMAGGVRTASQLSEELPVLAGTMLGLVQENGSINRNIPMVEGFLEGTTDIAGDIKINLVSITGRVTAITGSSAAVKQSLPRVIGSLGLTSGGKGVIAGNLRITGKLLSYEENSGAIIGNLPFAVNLHAIQGSLVTISGGFSIQGALEISPQVINGDTTLTYERGQCE